MYSSRVHVVTLSSLRGDNEQQNAVNYIQQQKTYVILHHSTWYINSSFGSRRQYSNKSIMDDVRIGCANQTVKRARSDPITHEQIGEEEEEAAAACHQADRRHLLLQFDRHTRPCRCHIQCPFAPRVSGPDQCAHGWVALQRSRNGPATSAWFNGFVARAHGLGWTGASKTTTTAMVRAWTACMGSGIAQAGR